MERLPINAAFARNVSEAYSVLSYMRSVLDAGRDQIRRSRETLDSSHAILKSAHPVNAI